jgi:hypothetical protein
MIIPIDNKLECARTWTPKLQGVILVPTEKDIAPLFRALCAQDEYWKFYPELIKVAPASITHPSDLEPMCEYCGKTDIYNVEELKEYHDFLIYQHLHPDHNHHQ